MANYCEVCGKGKLSGNHITHADRKIKRTWKPNIRKVKVMENGSPKRKYVCTRCLRSGNVERAL